MIYKLSSIIILFSFYGIYIGKMLIQRKKGIVTNQIGKGNKSKSILIIENIMKIATYSIVIVQLISILINKVTLLEGIRIIGIIIGVLGVLFFALAVISMKDSWRAGISTNDETKIVTKGIYKYSRNPAFLGFYLVYIGILLINFNVTLLIFTIFTIIMLHIQILQEEQYLPNVFGKEYTEYKLKVHRYLGRK